MKGLIAVALASTLASAAVAQGPTVGPGIQGNEPLDITANGSAFDNTTCKVTFTGNVEVIQGQSRVRSPQIEAYYSRTGSTAASGTAGSGSARCGGQVDRIEASGPVYYVTPEQSARSDHATFTAGNDTLVMTGNVVLNQGQNVMTGARAVMNTRTRNAQIEAGPSAQSNGRVRAVIFPNQQTAAGAARPAARPGR